MRHAPRVLLPGLLLGLALIQAGCQSEYRPWIPPQEYKAKIVSDAAFVRTNQGEYVDGYLVEYESDFQKLRMFMVLEIPHYSKGERLIVTGRLTDDSVRMPFGDDPQERFPVFQVERAQPNVPAAPNIPALK